MTEAPLIEREECVRLIKLYGRRGASDLGMGEVERLLRAALQTIELVAELEALAIANEADDLITRLQRQIEQTPELKNGVLEDAAEALRTKDARIAVLETALRPFDRYARAYPDAKEEANVIVSMRAVRGAAAALKGEPAIGAIWP